MADPLFLIALGVLLAGAFLGAALGIPVGYALGYRHGRRVSHVTKGKA